MNLSELLKNQDKISSAIETEAADTERNQGDVEMIQLVSFVLDEVEYGVDILAVHEILRMPDITRLPNTPVFIKGVINLRGNVIPVVDVRVRFGFPTGRVTDLARIIVIETNDKLVGLLVDNVHQVVRIPRSHVDPPSELIDGVSDEFITGIGRLKGRLIVILNMTNIIFDEDELRSEQSPENTADTVRR
jgi:purine-binding chemotaxis protein CheW